MASVVSILLQESMGFCYTQTKGVYGVSKQSIREKYGHYLPALIIRKIRDKYNINLRFVDEDIEYVYVTEVENG